VEAEEEEEEEEAEDSDEGFDGDENSSVAREAFSGVGVEVGSESWLLKLIGNDH